MLYLGIDFGTSFTKAAVFDTKKAAGGNSTQATIPIKLSSFKGGKVSEYSENNMPTVAFVSAKTGHISVGYEALNQRLSPNGTFYCNFKPMLDLGDGNIGYDRIHQRIVVAILVYVRSRAMTQMNETFNDVVLTVPASTGENSVRRKLMKRAAVQAGFRHVDIIPEPEAAAYYLLNNNLKAQNGNQYIIYDFGGGTFDTSIIVVRDSQVFVVDKSVGSDNETKWGGVYIDAAIRKDYMSRSAKAKKWANMLRENLPIHMALEYSDHLRNEPINAKISLSKHTKFVNSFNDYTLTREAFESIPDVRRMVEDTLECSLSLLQYNVENNLCGDLQHVNTIFLVGGSSRLPMVNAAWNELKQRDMSLVFNIVSCPLDAVACGAARYNFMKPSPGRLVTDAVAKISKHDYSTAALYIGKASKESDVAKTCMALLYYSCILTKSKKAYNRALALIGDISRPEAYEMKALMTFLGHGVKKDDDQVKLLLNKIDSNYEGEIFKLLNEVVNNGDWTHLDSIYHFDAKNYISNLLPLFKTEKAEKDDD